MPKAVISENKAKPALRKSLVHLILGKLPKSGPHTCVLVTFAKEIAVEEVYDQKEHSRGD